MDGRRRPLIHPFTRPRRADATQIASIRHDAGSSARPYVDGALMAIRKVSTLVGVHRGLDSVLDL